MSDCSSFFCRTGHQRLEYIFAYLLTIRDAFVSDMNTLVFPRLNGYLLLFTSEETVRVKDIVGCNFDEQVKMEPI